MSNKNGVKCPTNVVHNAFMIWEKQDPSGETYYVLECIDCRRKGLLRIKKGVGRDPPQSLAIDWNYEEPTK